MSEPLTHEELAECKRVRFDGRDPDLDSPISVRDVGRLLATIDAWIEAAKYEKAHGEKMQRERYAERLNNDTLTAQLILAREALERIDQWDYRGQTAEDISRDALAALDKITEGER